MVKGLRWEIALAVGFIFMAAACVSLVALYPLEQSRSQAMLDKIERSVHAMASQRTETLANELFMKHYKAVRVTAGKMSETEQVLAVAVYDQAGKLITATDQPVPEQADPEQIDVAGKGYSIAQVTWRGRSALFYLQPVRAIGRTLGVLAIYHDLEEDMRGARQARVIFAALLFGIFASMAGVLSLMLSRKVISPVKQLAAAMRRVQEGRLGEQVDLHSNNEIGDMAQAFNIMSAENQRMVQALDELNKNLEQRVSRRTRELSEANELLQQEIAERKAAQDELLRAKEQADAASKAKSEFLSVMSHEIRTPLNAIQGMAQALEEAGLPDEQAKYLEVLSSASQSLLMLINDILDLTRVESGRLELADIPFNFTELIGDVCGLFSESAATKGVKLQCTVDPQLGGAFAGDPYRLRQVAVNLVSNAVKFTDKGVVSVTAGLQPPAWLQRQGTRQRPPAFENAATIYVNVADSGMGVPEAQQKMIFDKFTQMDASITRKHGGAGLGLNIAAGLVKLMGGELAMRSTPGQGSEFCFSAVLTRLPDEERLSAPAPAPKPEDLPPMDILLVEDSEYNALVVETFLKNSPVNLDLAPNGQEGLRLLAQKHYDLVLMDMQMPVMDGFTATRMLRQKEKEQGLPRTPVAAMTAYALKGDKERCLDAGCDKYIAKPVRREVLLGALAEAAELEGKPAPGGPAAAAFPESTPEQNPALVPQEGDILVSVQDEDLRAIAPQYLESVKRDLATVLAAAGKPDFAAVRAVCHRLKGEGAAMGFSPITDIGAAMHAAAKAEDAPGVLQAAEKMRNYLDRVVLA